MAPVPHSPAKVPGIRSGRAANQLRPVLLTPDYVATAEGSVLISIGHTRVLCNATIEQGVPPWLRNSGRGWVTAEYGMLPALRSLARRASPSAAKSPAAPTRSSDSSAALYALSSTCMRSASAPSSLTVTYCRRTGARAPRLSPAPAPRFAISLNRLVKAGTLKQSPLRQLVAATSVGIVDNEVLLDLAYEEDSQAEVDMNIVMTEDGGLVEVQATAEQKPFPRNKMLEMMDYAEAGIRELFAAQRALLSS